MPAGLNTRLLALSESLSPFTPNGVLFPLSLPVPWHSASPREAVPLTAVLLEYPFAYTPGDGSGPFLSNVELIVFICSLVRPGQSEHVLLQFSCPESIVRGLGDISDQLRKRFEPRISRAGLGYELVIRSRIERLDRVAL